MNKATLISYAQLREDVVILALLEGVNKGFYVDVGANHPTIDSVTKYFYDKGWHGINIEPIHKLYKLLKNERPKDLNLNLGVSNREDTLLLREYIDLDGHSTFSEETKRTKDVDRTFVEYEVKVVTLKKIFTDYKVKRIDFLKVDVEGFEKQVIEGNDWKKFRPKVVCLEADHKHNDWRTYFKKIAYTFVLFDGLNEYYIANEYIDILDGFSERLVTLNHDTLKLHQYLQWKQDFQQAQLGLTYKNKADAYDREIKKRDLEIEKLQKTSYLHRSYLGRVKVAIKGLTVGWIRDRK